jgi:hypothetical protein
VRVLIFAAADDNEKIRLLTLFSGYVLLLGAEFA